MLPHWCKRSVPKRQTNLPLSVDRKGTENSLTILRSGVQGAMGAQWSAQTHTCSRALGPHPTAVLSSIVTTCARRTDGPASSACCRMTNVNLSIELDRED